MRGRRLGFTIGLMLCVLIGISAFFLYSRTNAQAHNGLPCTSLGTTQKSTGIILSIAYAPANKPCFTANDVSVYLKTHSVPQAGTISGKPAKILSIDFITGKEASDRMKGDSVGVADNAPVCYVELYGPFVSGSVPEGAKSLVSDKGVEIFDARTGNLLDWWMPDTN